MVGNWITHPNKKLIMHNRRRRLPSILPRFVQSCLLHVGGVVKLLLLTTPTWPAAGFIPGLTRLTKLIYRMNRKFRWSVVPLSSRSCCSSPCSCPSLNFYGGDGCRGVPCESTQCSSSNKPKATPLPKSKVFMLRLVDIFKSWQLC